MGQAQIAMRWDGTDKYVPWTILAKHCSEEPKKLLFVHL